VVYILVGRWGLEAGSLLLNVKTSVFLHPFSTLYFNNFLNSVLGGKLGVGGWKSLNLHPPASLSQPFTSIIS